jgi:hypothetical protein
MKSRHELIEVGAFHLSGAIPVRVRPIENDRDRQLAASVFWSVYRRDAKDDAHHVDDFPTRKAAVLELETGSLRRAAE